MLIGQLAMPVYAEEKDSALEKTYEDELSSAIISGSGTEDDPYICDFDKAPFFKNYLKEVNATILENPSFPSAIVGITSVFSQVIKL